MRRPLRLLLLLTTIPLLLALACTDSADHPAAPPQEARLVAQGFSQEAGAVGWAFVVENPSTTRVTGVHFDVLLYSDDGTVAATEAGGLNVLWPGERFGFAGRAAVGAGRAGRMEVRLRAMRAAASDPGPRFRTTGVALRRGPQGVVATGSVVSPSAQEMQQVHVAAIAYDEGGAIVGGGTGTIATLPANGAAEVEVPLTAAAAARVELYPAARSSLSAP